jgi:hypothetical protein
LAVINCPKCNAAVSDEDKQCGACGILFEKWKEREDNVATGNMARYTAIANATSGEFNWTILLIFCGAIVALFYYIGHNVN